MNVDLKKMSRFLIIIIEHIKIPETAVEIKRYLKHYFREQELRQIYMDFWYKILPIIWKDHKAIEIKKEEHKLTFLANELHGAGRIVEAHIVRTVVKPYIRDLNKKWSEMTTLEKLKYYRKVTFNYIGEIKVIKCE